MEWKEKQKVIKVQILTSPVDLFLIPYFRPISANFQNETDCKSKFSEVLHSYCIIKKYSYAINYVYQISKQSNNFNIVFWGVG